MSATSASQEDSSPRSSDSNRHRPAVAGGARSTPTMRKSANCCRRRDPRLPATPVIRRVFCESAIASYPGSLRRRRGWGLSLGLNRFFGRYWRSRRGSRRGLFGPTVDVHRHAAHAGHDGHCLFLPEVSLVKSDRSGTSERGHCVLELLLLELAADLIFSFGKRDSAFADELVNRVAAGRVIQLGDSALLQGKDGPFLVGRQSAAAPPAHLSIGGRLRVGIADIGCFLELI